MLQMQHLKEKKLGEQTTKYCNGTGGADPTVPVSFALRKKEKLPNITGNYPPRYLTSALEDGGR